MDNKERIVLVTGFGPFGKHTVNASWEAVTEIEKMSADLKQTYDVNIITEKIPVAYEHVSKRVPQLWAKHKPLIVLHLGVSNKAKCLTVESKACSKGYTKPDVNNQLCLNEDECPEKVLKTCIDVRSICNYVNANSTKSGCEACVSDDAGRYLCEYTFYNSLNIDPERTLFIHVPDLDVYSSAQTAKGIYDIICHLIKSKQNL